MSCIIYALTNKTNGKIYIGQTWQTLKDRWDSGHGYKSCIYLYNAIKKYGKENFEYTILTTTDHQLTANWLENFWINTCDSRNPEIGYNIREGGSTGRLSEKSRLKMINSLKTGYANGTIINAFKGKKHTEKYKKQMSEMRKKYFKNHTAYNKGKLMSQESKEKLSKSCMGRVPYNKGIKTGKLSHNRIIFTEEQLLSIKNDNRTNKIIAKEYNTSDTTIGKIKRGIR